MSFPRGPERRQFGRRRTYVHATILARGRPAEPCVMRDVSEGGALLEVRHPRLLPSRFRLVAEAIGFQAECELAHRGENTAGVRFITPVTLKF